MDIKELITQEDGIQLVLDLYDIKYELTVGHYKLMNSSNTLTLIEAIKDIVILEFTLNDNFYLYNNNATGKNRIKLIAPISKKDLF